MKLNNKVNLINNQKMKSIFDFNVINANNNLVKLSDYNTNNPILIVNVATY